VVNDGTTDNGRNAHCAAHARGAMGGKPPLARVYVHDADLGDGGVGADAGMPSDDFNDPYARKQAILRGLGLDAGGRAPEGYPNAQLVTVPVPRTRVEASLFVRGDRVFVELEYLPHGDMDAALAVHGGAYVRYLATAWDRWCRTPPENRCRFFRRPLATESESRRNDKRGRVGGWSAGVPALVPSNFVNRSDKNTRPGSDVHAETCWYHTDGDTPVFKGLAPSLAGDMRVVESIVAAMETELRRGLQNDENVYYYALVSHPGHHAGFASAGGYCYLNNAAVLARSLSSSSLSLTRLAILDVDYHAGNGTASLFYDDPDVLVCSIHGDPNGDYPWNAGYADDTGVRPGAGQNQKRALAAGRHLGKRVRGGASGVSFEDRETRRAGAHRIPRDRRARGRPRAGTRFGWDRADPGGLRKDGSFDRQSARADGVHAGGRVQFGKGGRHRPRGVCRDGGWVPPG
jgi:acetoin utilization deacetylase AcuC-like enzyme